MKQIVFQLLKNKVSTVCYVDNQTTWGKLMTTTVCNIPEFYYHYLEAIQNSAMESVCLITGCDYLADALTKASDNRKLERANESSKSVTNSTCVFMLQFTRYSNVSNIPTVCVPMISDNWLNSNYYKMEDDWVVWKLLFSLGYVVFVTFLISANLHGFALYHTNMV